MADQKWREGRFEARSHEVAPGRSLWGVWDTAARDWVSDDGEVLVWGIGAGASDWIARQKYLTDSAVLDATRRPA